MFVLVYTSGSRIFLPSSLVYVWSKSVLAVGHPNRLTDHRGKALNQGCVGTWCAVLAECFFGCRDL